MLVMNSDTLWNLRKSCATGTLYWSFVARWFKCGHKKTQFSWDRYQEYQKVFVDLTPHLDIVAQLEVFLDTIAGDWLTRLKKTLNINNNKSDNLKLFICDICVPVFEHSFPGFLIRWRLWSSAVLKLLCFKNPAYFLHTFNFLTRKSSRSDP